MQKPFECDVNEVIPNLWLGNYKSACDKKFLDNYKIKNIVTIMDNFDNKYKYSNITYFTVPIKDKFVCNVDMNIVFDIISNFIKRCMNKGEAILVHCLRGHHRSASLVVAYLIKYNNADYVKCIDYINKLRPYALRRDTCMTVNLFKYYLFISGKQCDMVCGKHGPVYYCTCAS